MKTLLFCFFTIILIQTTSAQHLWINDPQNWRGGIGTIEETQITYQPKGLFMQVDWEITFSAKGLNEFTENDTVEVVYYFNLPEGAVVNDSWLWFEDSIIHSLIIDRWSASRVYENIVGRRRDPSILYKQNKTNYELRIFPMAAKENRKVKLSFLLPCNWSDKEVKTSFISQNLAVSKNPIEKIDVFAKCDSEWGTPSLVGNTVNPLQTISEDENENTHYLSLPWNNLIQYQSFALKSPMQNGYYFSYFEAGEEKIYQLAIDPTEKVKSENSNKTLFFIDYQKNNSDINQTALLNLLQNNLIQLLNDQDSFNIFYYDFELQQASENWIPGDSSSIVNAIKSLGAEPFVSYSNLPSLLASGLTKATEEPDSKVVLLANSDKIDDINVANDLIDDLLELMNPIIPIFIGDFQTQNYYNSWINNVNYRGNEYFYRNLAKLTGGDYYHLFDGGTTANCIQNIYFMATNQAGLIDIHTTLESGFCYGRFNSSEASYSSPNNIHLEVGRYAGDYPFNIEISGIYADELFTNSISFTKEEVSSCDSLLATWWYGNEIQEMETADNSYSIINDIIDKSIDNRILSLYTAFLCLEPSIMGELNNTNRNENVWGPDDGITTEAEAISETTQPEIKAYPNPFTEQVNIEIQLPLEVMPGDASFEIYDLFGKRIKVFNADDITDENNLVIRWNTTDHAGGKVPKGTYIFICTTPKGRVTTKLILM